MVNFGIYYRRLTETAIMPKRQTSGSVGYDLYADEETVIPPWGIDSVSAGVALEMSPGMDYHAEVRSRSGMALKSGVFVLNSPGTVDTDYIGPIKAILANFTEHPFPVYRGDRIAQLVFTKFATPELRETTRPVAETVRGSGGFGSTGR